MLKNIEFVVLKFVLLLYITVVLASCKGDPHQKYPRGPQDKNLGKIFNKDIVLWSNDDSGLIHPKRAIEEDRGKKLQYDVTQTGGSVGEKSEVAKNVKNSSNVNEYLWRAALNRVSSMPVVVADKKAGLITTDWYSSGVCKGRCKINVIFHSAKFKLNALEVKIFRDSKSAIGREWETVDSKNSEAANKMRDDIINEARKLRYFDEIAKKK